MSFLGEIGDLFFGGSQSKAADAAAEGAIQEGQIGLQGTRESIAFLQNQANQNRVDTTPGRFAEYSARNQIAFELGLPQNPYGFDPGTAGGTAGGGISAGVSGLPSTAFTGDVPQPTSSVGNAARSGIGAYAGYKTGELAADAVFRSGAGGALTSAVGQNAAGALLEYAPIIGAVVSAFSGTKGRSAEAKIFKGAATAVGGYFGGPIGAAVGSMIGGAVAGKHDPRYGVQIGPGGQLVDESGNDLGRITLPQEGLAAVPNISRDGHQILVDPQGNFYSGVQSGGQNIGGVEVLPLGGGFNLSQSGQGFVGLPDVTNTSGGAKFPKYQPSLTGIAGQIGVPSGEQRTTPVFGIESQAGQPITQSSFRQTPGYQFVRDEALRAAEQSAAARGGLVSGKTYRELERYGSGLASTEYDNYFRRLEGQANPYSTAQTILANTGLADGIANSTLAGAQAFGQGISNAANFRSSGELGRSSSILGTIGKAAELYGTYKSLAG